MSYTEAQLVPLVVLIHEIFYHSVVTDYKKGFGGQYGLQEDRQDKSAVGFEHHEKLAQHESQTDYAKGHCLHALLK